MSTNDWKMVFENMVKASRETVADIDAMPPEKVDKPLADFRDGLRAALDQYDHSKPFVDRYKEKLG